ncbi:MAG: hypothetical protein WC830_16810 [Burkholderiales bacterium]|jgi:hypothetical protein
MNTGKLLAAGALAFVLSAGLAHAKIPVPPMDDAARAKAEEAKAKAAAAAKKDAEDLAKAQDRVAEYYKKSHGMAGKPAAKSAKPAVKTRE